MNFWRITETEEGVQFSLKIQPRASKNEIVGIYQNALKIRLTAPPVDGEANEASVKFIAQWLDVAKNAVEIIHGHTGRNKTIAVKGLNKEKLLRKLQQETNLTQGD